MIDKQEFKAIRKDLAAYERQRERLIQTSRDMIKRSKELIHALHREHRADADVFAKQMANAMASFPKRPWESNIGSTAVQEFVEALSYYHLVTDGRLPTREELQVDTPEYLMGLCDLSGELVRKAYKDAIEERDEQVFRWRSVVDDLYYEFLQLQLRGDLRKKADAIKYNLQKLEEVAFKLRVSHTVGES